MKKFSLKEIVIPAISLLIICFVVTLFLVLTNMVTKKPIENQQKQKQDISRKMVLPEVYEFKEYQAIEGCYIGYDTSGEIIGYTFITKSSGYSGDISVMTGIEKSGMVKGVVVLSQSETPGLGANIQKDEFLNKYKGKKVKDRISVVKKSVPKDNEVEAVTGATISSKAATKAVNDALYRYSIIENSGGVN